MLWSRRRCMLWSRRQDACSGAGEDACSGVGEDTWSAYALTGVQTVKTGSLQYVMRLRIVSLRIASHCIVQAVHSSKSMDS